MFENAAAYYLTMGPNRGRRVRKIEVPTDSVTEFELGDSRYPAEGGERRGKLERGRRPNNSIRGRRRPGGRRQERRNHTLKRRELQKKGPGQRKVTLKQKLLEERRDHHTHNTRRGT